MSRSPISTILRRHRATTPFPELALTLLLFTDRLYDKLRADEASTALFLAREGRFLRELFGIYQSTMQHAESPVTAEYVYVSRRALYAASLPDDGYTFDGLRQRYPNLDPHDFVGSLGFPAAVRDQLVDGAESVDDLIASDTFRSAFETQRIEQRSLALSYITPFVDNGERGIHVVDVGWKGSMQDFLGDLLGRPSPIHGWYLGLGPNVQRKSPDGFTKRGLLFEAGPPSSRYFSVFAHFKSLYESLLNAGHGSVAGYRRTNHGVEPVLDELPEETEQHATLIEPIQREIVETFAELCEALDSSHLRRATFERNVARHHARAIFRPRRHEIEVVRSMHHYENFGSMALRSRGLTNGLSSVGGTKRSSPATSNAWPPLRAVENGRSWTVLPAGLMRTAKALGLERTRASAPCNHFSSR